MGVNPHGSVIAGDESPEAPLINDNTGYIRFQMVCTRASSILGSTGEDCSSDQATAKAANAVQ